MSIIVTGRGIYGTHSQDNFTGGDSDDRFHMTADNYVTDTINGGRGSDTVDYSLQQDGIGVTITLTDPTKTGGESHGTVEAVFPTQYYDRSTGSYVQLNHHQVVANLTSIENATGTDYNDVLNGNSSDNVLNGGAGDDVIKGGAGDDIIIGGAGRDVMTGGPDHDTFVFNHASDTPLGIPTELDLITDFVHGEDQIDLHNLVNETAGNHALNFIGRLDFSGHAGEVQWDFADFLGTSHGRMVQVDLDGDKHADVMFLVGPTTSHDYLFASDFILV